MLRAHTLPERPFPQVWTRTRVAGRASGVIGLLFATLLNRTTTLPKSGWWSGFRETWLGLRALTVTRDGALVF